jgi:hypothetical protein
LLEEEAVLGAAVAAVLEVYVAALKVLAVVVLLYQR